MTVDEIDFFDPWPMAGQDPAASARRATRWRMRAAAPEVRPTHTGQLTVGSAAGPGANPQNVVERLRAEAADRLGAIAARLSQAGHEASVVDVHPGTGLTLELSFTPRCGPLDKQVQTRRSWVHFVFGHDVIIVRRSVHAPADDARDVARLSYEAIDATWIESRVLDFVEEVLRRV